MPLRSAPRSRRRDAFTSGLPSEFLGKRQSQATESRNPPLAPRGPHRLRVPEDVASAPDRLDVVPSLGSLHELPPKLMNEHVDDLLLRLVHSPVEVVQEHLLRDGRPLPG